MNEHKGFLGTLTTTGSAVVSILPVVNEVVQIVAGLVAIVVGLLTARYYLKKTRNLP